LLITNDKFKSFTFTKIQKNSSETGALVQRNNYKLVAILLTIFGVIILIQAFRWQVLESDKFADIAQQQYTILGSRLLKEEGF
jgi:hypothetical protein